MQNLLWVPHIGCLISGSFDKTIISWEVVNEQGLAVELNGHSDRIVGVSYDKSRRLLVSCSSDGHIVIWPMDVKRTETPRWIKRDSCQICNTPFFWNFREMWERKTIGFRQVSLRDKLGSFHLIHFIHSIIVGSVVALFVTNAQQIVLHCLS